jgi:hypothetical protein
VATARRQLGYVSSLTTQTSFVERYGVATGGSSSSITVSGQAYTLLTFTSTGTLTVTQAGLFDYTFVGAGGAGGTNGRGGGAGGCISQGTLYLSANETITIGAGVAGSGNATRSNERGSSTTNTSSEVIAPCGAFGGGDGGIGQFGGGDGGDHSSVGSTAGGNGTDISLWLGEAATTTYKSGGGGGGADSGAGGAGGLGGGGNGQGPSAATAGAANSGGGGGGAKSGGTAGANNSGGSGIAYIRFKV